MGTYNYSARELADEINTLLNNLEGDFQIGELEKALRLVAVEQKREPDAVKVAARKGKSPSRKGSKA